jgi:hypothetical protein
MPKNLQITLLGELRVTSDGTDVALPASKKARALLAYLVATDRPHRRERLCEVFWNMPDDPKAALRWALSKLRGAFSTSDGSRIVADRERVKFDTGGVEVDIRTIYARLLETERPPTIEELTSMAEQLGRVFLDGLDGVGDDAFDLWLMSEREDARLAHVTALRRLVLHPDMSPVAARKWRLLWQDADPTAVLPPEKTAAAAPDTGQLVPVPSQRDQEEAVFAPPAEQRVQQIAQRKAGALRAQRIGFCEVRDGTNIACATLGSGPPLLKAANWLNQFEFDWNSPIWGGSFAEIARNRTLIRYDERGWPRH